MLQSGLPELISNDEPLARFLTSRSYYNQWGPKASAFLPNRADFKTSVFRHGKDPAARLWQIAEDQIRGRTVYGAAIVIASHVRRVGLEAEAEEPPLRHANIAGWPNDPSDLELSRAKAKEVALRLVEGAELIVPT